MSPDVSVAVRQKYVARLHSLHFSVGSSFIGCFGSDPPASRSCAAVLTRNLTLGFRSSICQNAGFDGFPRDSLSAVARRSIRTLSPGCLCVVSPLRCLLRGEKFECKNGGRRCEGGPHTKSDCTGEQNSHVVEKKVCLRS